jgi:hypothetical protein
MKTRSHKRKRKPVVMTSGKSDRVVIINPPESKEGDTCSLSRLIETGTPDPEKEGLSRLVGKAGPGEARVPETGGMELKQAVEEKEGEKREERKELRDEEYEKEEE